MQTDALCRKRILPHHSRSFKVTENGTVQKLWYGFLFAFHSNHGRTFSGFDTIHERDRHPATARQQELRYAASLGYIADNAVGRTGVNACSRPDLTSMAITLANLTHPFFVCTSSLQLVTF